MLKLNPQYEVEFGTVKDWSTSSLGPLIEPVKASEEHNTWADCGRYDPAKAIAIWEGINHLNHVCGTPVSKPGPGICGRVSCSYNSAIWWCNDVGSCLSLFLIVFIAPRINISAPSSHALGVDC